MTNAHHDPASSAPSTGAPAGPHYEGFDPELPEHQQRKILGLSSVQIGASAMAAVTSALAASFFGVAGTLIGAAVGSVISTIAGAMYAESMRRAAGRLRDAQTVVVQHVPFGTGQHPAQVPSSQALTQVVPAARADETLLLPADTAAGQALNGTATGRTAAGTSVPGARFDGVATANGTAAGTDLSHAAASTAERTAVSGTPGSAPTATTSIFVPEVSAVPGAPAADVTTPSDAVPGTDVPGAALLNPGADGSGAGSGGPGGSEGNGGDRPWWRRPVFTLTIVGVAGFLIAIGIITGIEGLTGHTLSGGSGTSLSRIGGRSATPKPSPTVTVTTSTPTATRSTATVTASPTATQAPVVPTTDPSAPASTSSAPGASGTATAPDVTSSTGSSAESSSGVDAVSSAAPGN